MSICNTNQCPFLKSFLLLSNYGFEITIYLLRVHISQTKNNHTRQSLSARSHQLSKIEIMG